MKVRASWEFEVDTGSYDPKFIDIPGLTKELTKIELDHMLKNNELTSDDFEYSVVII